MLSQTAIEVAASSSVLKTEGDDVTMSSSPPIDDAQRFVEEDLFPGLNGNSNTNLLAITIQDESTAAGVDTQKGLTSTGLTATVQLTSAKSHIAIDEDSTASHEETTHKCPPITVVAIEKELASQSVDDAQRRDEKEFVRGHGGNSNTNVPVTTLQVMSTGEGVGTQKTSTSAGPTPIAQATGAKSHIVDRKDSTAGHQETTHESEPLTVVEEGKEWVGITAGKATREVPPLSPIPRTSDGGSPGGMIGVDPTDNEANADVYLPIVTVVGKGNLLGDDEGEALHSLQGLRQGSRRDEGMKEVITKGWDLVQTVAGDTDGRSPAGHQENAQSNTPVTTVLEDNATLEDGVAHAYKAPRNADSPRSGGDKPGHCSPFTTAKDGNVRADGDEKPPPAAEHQSPGHDTGRREGDGRDEVEGGRVVYVGRAEEFEAVWFAGQRESANVKVSFRLCRPAVSPCWRSLIDMLEVAMTSAIHLIKTNRSPPSILTVQEVSRPSRSLCCQTIACISRSAGSSLASVGDSQWHNCAVSLLRPENRHIETDKLFDPCTSRNALHTWTDSWSGGRAMDSFIPARIFS